MHSHHTPPTRVGGLPFIQALPILLVAGALLLFTPGCTTTGSGERVFDQQRAWEITLKGIGSNGTIYALGEHPEWRPHFERASADLDALTASEGFTIEDLLLIVHRLPVDQLKDKNSALLINNLTLTIEEIGRGRLDLSAVDNLKPYAIALNDGVKRGLLLTAPQE